MPSIEDSAYPRFKSNINQRELEAIYTPTHEEILLSKRVTKGEFAQFCFIVTLKTFQRLGYFVLLSHVPYKVINYIAEKLGVTPIPNISTYEQSGSRFRHIEVIRSYLQVTAYGKDSQKIIEKAITEAAQTKEDIVDIINVAIEELVRLRHELPAFSTLLRAAYKGRSKVNQNFYQQIYDATTEDSRKRIDKLFVINENQITSSWNYLKTEPKRPTRNNIKEHVAYFEWLSKYTVDTKALDKIPDVKVKQFSAEAKSLNASQMKELKAYKKYAVAVALVHVQLAKALDDLADILIKSVTKIHNKAQEALTELQEKNQDRTDQLIATLHQILVSRQEGETEIERDKSIQKVIGNREAQLIKDCEEHAIYAGKNYFPLLWQFHVSYRQVLLDILKILNVKTTTMDRVLIEAVNFIQRHRTSRKNFIIISQNDVSDLSWIGNNWWKFVFEKTRDSDHNPRQLNRRNFELCVLYYVMLALKSGDLYIENSDQFSDYSKQLIDWEQYHKLINEYGEQVELPVEKDAFIEHIKQWLKDIASSVDDSFPENEYVTIYKGIPKIKKSKKKVHPTRLKQLEKMIADRIKPVSILDVITNTQKWIEWDSSFGPLSGYDDKLDNAKMHYILSTFCYGCDLGPVQTERSIDVIGRRQIAWINQRHINEVKLNEAIVKVINAYNRFDLPKLWGSGNSASADGTQWNMYEQNLMSEYHIRYGDYGGIGYYHVSDTYIALFSHFIPCGVYEAVYILDGLLNNESDIQPNTLHGDTHAQSEVVFGLAYLLGIKLMPRIRHWKELVFYHPDLAKKYNHINQIFTGEVDWKLIEKYLPDMLRVTLSIKTGQISASTILRRLGTYSRKNKLYKAFRELGRVVRTGFLLHYLGDKELREMIQAATCKSESYNRFAQWLAFGKEGIITENNRDEQRKFIKYNHLVANCLSFYNVFLMTNVVNELIAEGYRITDEELSALSPYITKHVNRFGDYQLNFEQDMPSIQYEILKWQDLT